MAWPEAVLWDLDGTIVDSEPIWMTALDSVATELGRGLTPEVAQQISGTDDRATMRIMAEHTGADLPDHEWVALHDRVVEHVIAAIAQEPPIHPGALETLRGLRAAGVPQALVTSSPRHIAETVLAALDPGLFVTSVTSEDVTERKPDPAPYLRAARVLEVAPSRCWAVEDSPSGAASAQSAGCRVHIVPSATESADGPGRERMEALTDLLTGFGSRLSG